jgi:hypothetical protein
MEQNNMTPILSKEGVLEFILRASTIELTLLAIRIKII